MKTLLHSRASARAIPGALRTGPVAVPAASVGALALGALAVGAVAVGAVAIGRLVIRRARIHRLEIDTLSIRRIEGPAPRLVYDPAGEETEDAS